MKNIKNKVILKTSNTFIKTNLLFKKNILNLYDKEVNFDKMNIILDQPKKYLIFRIDGINNGVLYLLPILWKV